MGGLEKPATGTGKDARAPSRREGTDVPRRPLTGGSGLDEPGMTGRGMPPRTDEPGTERSAPHRRPRAWDNRHPPAARGARRPQP